MTTATKSREDWTLVHQVYTDPSPLPTNHRNDVILAIILCAKDHDNEVHASWVREYLPLDCDPHLRGNVMANLSRKGILARTGRYLPSGDSENRNALRDLPVRRVTSMARLAHEVTL